MQVSGLLGGSHLAFLLPAFVLTVAINIWSSLPARLLVGLRCYLTLEAVPQERRAAAKPVRPRKGKKKGGSGGGAAGDEPSSDQNLLMTRLSIRDIHNAEFFPSLDSLFFLSQLAACNMLITELASRYIAWWPQQAMSLVLAALAAVASLVTLARADLLSKLTSKEDKIYAGVWAVLSFFVARKLLAAPPSSVPQWDVAAAAAAVQPLLASALAGYERLDVAHLPAPAPAALEALLALGAAAISMLLFAPCLRFARAYWLQRNAPAWAADYIPRSWLASLLLHLHVALPMLTALLWMEGFVRDTLVMTPAQAAAAQPAVLLAMAALSAASLRTLEQRFLDETLVVWHALKHGTSDGGVLAAAPAPSPAAAARRVATREAIIKAKALVVKALLGKAAVQYLAPAALHLGLGLVLLYGQLHPGLGGGQGLALLRCVAGFLAWWTGLVTFFLTASDLLMFKLGMLR